LDEQPTLAANERQALEFFFEHLRQAVERADAPADELLYNASILAHYALTSTTSQDFPRAPATLETVFDVFVLDRSQHTDPEIMEAAGSQCLLLTGFFGAQLIRRHNVNWYASLGASFYDRAAMYSRHPARRAMMGAMAVRFDFWRRQQAKLARELAEQASDARYLLAHDRPA
jgi:hypothetical protein